MIGSTLTISVAATVLCITCITPAAFGDEPARKLAQSESTDVARFSPGGIIRLVSSCGELMIEGWDRQEVETTVVKWIDHEVEPSRMAETTQRLESAKVTIEHISGGEIKLSTVKPLRQIKIKYHIYAPRDARIAVDHHGGYVLVTGMTGDIDVANRSGDIVLMLPDPASYAIDARDKFGVVALDDGTATHKYLLGEQFTRDRQAPAHHMTLRMGFGGITIKEVPAEGEAPARGAR